MLGQTGEKGVADARQRDIEELKAREDLSRKLERFLKSDIIVKIDAAPGGRDARAVYVGENFHRLSIDDQNFVLRVVAELYGERGRSLTYLEVYHGRSATRIGSFRNATGFSPSR